MRIEYEGLIEKSDFFIYRTPSRFRLYRRQPNGKMLQVDVVKRRISEVTYVTFYSFSSSYYLKITTQSLFERYLNTIKKELNI